uniref:Uncharacterized LOC111196201 n=1 Tax=Astyanax mexicanus TaxID=7994 RepID=A0A3B1J2F9_ASTMX
MACLMKTAPSCILIVLFYIMSSAQAVEDLKREFISAQSDKPVTLDCKLEHQTVKENQFWYKLISGQEPQEVATKLKEKDKGSLSPGFDKLGFKLHDNFSLTIEQPNKAHEGMYFCGKDGNTNKFSKGTFVAVKDHSQSEISVLQSPAFQTLSPGEAVNLQCTVQPNNQPADQQVFWFRSSAGRSFPEIIFTHHSSSSSSNRQCEISSSKDGCVFNFTKNIFNTTDTGTYYCAVASCGRIIIGDGTPVDFKKPVDPGMMCLGAALGLCVVVIFAQAIFICKLRNGVHCG